MDELVREAAATAERLVAPLGRRWSHVQAVAERAGELSAGLPASVRQTAIAAAWLHDIGYAPELAHTGFHPLDGARWLHEHDWPDGVVNLVANHSGARYEAAERDLAIELADFPFHDSEFDDLMAAADLTTGPGGERFTFDERLAEILTRYPSESIVHRTWLVAGPVVRESVLRAQQRHSGAQSATG